MNLKDETAAGFDDVSVKILKYIAKNIVKSLSYIYNKSIKYKIFPDKFKLAVVKPLDKGGDKTKHK